MWMKMLWHLGGTPLRTRSLYLWRGCPWEGGSGGFVSLGRSPAAACALCQVCHCDGSSRARIKPEGSLEWTRCPAHLCYMTRGLELANQELLEQARHGTGDTLLKGVTGRRSESGCSLCSCAYLCRLGLLNFVIWIQAENSSPLFIWSHTFIELAFVKCQPSRVIRTAFSWRSELKGRGGHQSSVWESTEPQWLPESVVPFPAHSSRAEHASRVGRGGQFHGSHLCCPKGLRLNSC